MRSLSCQQLIAAAGSPPATGLSTTYMPDFSESAFRQIHLQIHKHTHKNTNTHTHIKNTNTKWEQLLTKLSPRNTRLTRLFPIAHLFEGFLRVAMVAQHRKEKLALLHENLNSFNDLPENHTNE